MAWHGKKRATRLSGGTVTAFSSDRLTKSGVKVVARRKIVRSCACAVWKRKEKHDQARSGLEVDKKGWRRGAGTCTVPSAEKQSKRRLRRPNDQRQVRAN